MFVAAAVVAVVVAIVALIGILPRGARKVGNTRMMTAARIVVVVALLAFAVYTFQYRP